VSWPSAPTKKEILFAVGFLRAAGYSSEYAQIVAERILTPGAELSAGDAELLEKFKLATAQMVGLVMRGEDPARPKDERQAELARVLERMIELLSSKTQRYTYGVALAQACRELGVQVERNSKEEQALLTAAFQVTSTGRIPGAPDA